MTKEDYERITRIIIVQTANLIEMSMTSQEFDSYKMDEWTKIFERMVELKYDLQPVE